jgi:hypothetical protein
MTNNDDSLAREESVLATTFYTYNSRLVVTNKRLIGRQRLKIGRSTFEGEIPLDTIVDLWYSRGTLIEGDPGLFIEHKLPDGSITKSRVCFQSSKTFGHTPQQIYELIQDLVSQPADADGMRNPSSAMKRQLEEIDKRARKLRGTVLMAAVFTISGELTALVYNLVTGEAEFPGLATFLATADWFIMLASFTILLWGFIFSVLLAAIPIYFLINDSHLDLQGAIRWVVVGVVYALLWQLSSSLLRHFDIPITCLMGVLLRIPVAGLAYLLVFGLFLRMREKELAK